MINTPQDFWKGLGNFWLSFEDRRDIEAFWEGMLEALKESHRDLYKTVLTKFPNYSPDIWEHKYVSFDLVWSGLEDNRINNTNYFSLPDEFVGTFSIPILSGVETNQVLTQGSDYWVVEGNKLYFPNLETSVEYDTNADQSKQVTLYGEILQRVDPVIFNLYRNLASTELLVTGQDVYFPFTYDGDQSTGLVVDDTTFESGGAYDIRAVPLLNGNIMIIYDDASDGNYGKVVIRDPSGNAVAGPITFESDVSSYLSGTLLHNGNVMLAWRRGNTPYYSRYAIISESGSIVLASTAIPTVTDNSDEFNCVSLNNGNVMIPYVDLTGSLFHGKFVIVDQDGTIVKSQTTFETNGAVYQATTLLQNGNVMIAYRRYSDDYGMYVIYDQDGAAIKSPTVINSVNTGEQHCCTMDNGNVFISFRQTNSTGNFMILSPTGHILVSSTQFDSVPVYYNTSSPLRNGNVVTVYQDGGGNNEGFFVIHDQNGNLLEGPTVFTDYYAYDTWVETLANGTSCFLYSDGSNADIGTLDIYDFIGPTGTNAYMVEKVKLIKYMSWALFYLKMQKPTIQNLKWTYNILYNLPFAYEDGTVSISGLECTVGNYTYYIPTGETWGVSDSEAISRFQPLMTGIELQDRYSNPTEIWSSFGTIEDANTFLLNVDTSSRSNYSSSLVDDYEEDFIDKAFNKITTLT